MAEDAANICRSLGDRPDQELRVSVKPFPDDLGWSWRITRQPQEGA